MSRIGNALIRITPEVARFGQEAMAKATTELERSMRRVGGTLTKTLTPAAVAAGIAFRGAAREYVAGTQEIVFGTGAVGGELRGMRRELRRLSGRVPEDMEIIGRAIAGVNTRFELTGQQLRETSRLMIEFARITRQDVGDATDRAGRLMAALDLEVDQLEGALDKLAFAGQRSGIEVGRLMDFIVEAGPAFTELGFDLDRSIALFAQFEEVGARPAELLGSMNIVLTRLAREGFTDAQEAFEELMRRIREAPTFLEAVDIAADAFGSRVGAKVAEDIRAGTFAIEGWVEELQDAEGTVRRTARAGLSLGDRMSMLVGRFRGFVAPVAEAGTAISAFLAGLGPLLITLSFARGAVASLAAAKVALGAAAGPAIAKVVVALRALGAAAVTPPAGVILLIAAAITGLLLVIWRFRDEIGAALRAVADFFLRIFGRIFEFLVEWGRRVLAFMLRWHPLAILFRLMTEFMPRLREWLRALPGRIIDALRGLATTLVTWLTRWHPIAVAFRLMQQAWTRVREWLSGLWDPIREAWSRAWDRIGGIFSGIWSGIQDAFQRGVNFIIEWINRFIRQINRLIRTVNNLPFVNIPEIGEIRRLGEETPGGALDMPRQIADDLLGARAAGRTQEVTINVINPAAEPATLSIPAATRRAAFELAGA